MSKKGEDGMALYNVGDYIHDVRKRRGITQEELADGICSAGTLSRIENNSQTPTARTYCALMERLGEAPHLFSVFTNVEEIRSYKMSRRILRQISNHHLNGVDELLKDYTENIGEKNQIALQFAIYAKAICRSKRKDNPKQICRELQKALQLTMQEDVYNGIYKKKRILTSDEILIWNNIAIQYSRMGDTKKAKRILLGLKDHMNHQISDDEYKASLYPVIVCNIAKWMNEAEKYEEAEENCLEGIKMCLEYGKLVPLPFLFYQKANSHAKRKEHREARECFRYVENLLEIMQFEKEILAEEMIVAI
jgi:transcriptional regulator with XRE-family HTH domain